jgi:hypothetical protein
MSSEDTLSRYIEPNEIARRYGTKAGFLLIDFLQVALPIFVVPVDAIVIASKPMPLADEFILRSIEEGINTLADLSGFLGLDDEFVKKRLAAMIGDDLVSFSAASDSKEQAAILTAKGKEAMLKALVVQPKRESFVLAIDGITRMLLNDRPHRLLRSVDARAFGLQEIAALPKDRFPEFDEVAQMDLTGVAVRGAKRDSKIAKVMSLVHMGKRQRRFREATMLVFRAERGQEIHVEFVVDGRPHPQLNDAFARHEGAKALHIHEQVEASIAQAKKEIETVWPDLAAGEPLKSAAAIRPKVQPVVNMVGRLGSRIEQKEHAVEDAKSQEAVKTLRAEMDALRAEKAKVEAELNAIELRHLEVHEHRPLFEASLTSAKKRLVIVSPWIRDQVLTGGRLHRIRSLVEKGVDVYIGYGLGEDTKSGKDKGENAISFLKALASKHRNLHFRELGDTHAKILLVDDEFAVIGSFNWLSFEGDVRRNFREEMSYFVRVPPKVEELFEHYRRRFIAQGPEERPSKRNESVVVPDKSTTRRRSSTQPPEGAQPPRTIDDIVKSGESSSVEFKSTLRVNLHTKANDAKIEHSVLKTLAAFLNTHGGTLFIGVDDNGKPLGLEHDGFATEDKMDQQLANLIRERLGAHHMLNIHPRFLDLQGKRVLMIRCEKGNAPAYLKDAKGESFFIRVSATTSELPTSQIHDYIKGRFGR